MEKHERGLLRIPVLDDLMAWMGSFTDDELIRATKKIGFGVSADQVKLYLVSAYKRGIVTFKNKSFIYRENLADSFKQPVLSETTYEARNLEGELVTIRTCHLSRFYTRYSPN